MIRNFVHMNISGVLNSYILLFVSSELNSILFEISARCAKQSPLCCRALNTVPIPILILIKIKNVAVTLNNSYITIVDVTYIIYSLNLCDNNIVWDT